LFQIEETRPKFDRRT